MANELSKVEMHIKEYFKNYLPKYYSVLEVRRKSNHPDDGHLFMVSAQKNDGTYAVWTNWNESTQSLNHGHYDLKSVEDCEAIFTEYQNTQQYFAVYKCSQRARFRLFVTDNEEDAKRFCEEHHWEITDENHFIWSLNYSEINETYSSDGKEH